jgi:hypothetical protein
MQLFHNSKVFGSCIIHILYTGCAKIKKNSGAKRLTIVLPDTVHTLGYHRVYIRGIFLIKTFVWKADVYLWVMSEYVYIQQTTASKATTTRPTSETDEQQSTVKKEFYIIKKKIRQNL